MTIALALLFATRLRDGVTWPIFAAYGVSVLIGWRFAWHLHVFPLLEASEQPAEAVIDAARSRYHKTWAGVAAAGVALSSALWLV